MTGSEICESCGISVEAELIFVGTPHFPGKDIGGKVDQEDCGVGRGDLPVILSQKLILFICYQIVCM